MEGGPKHLDLPPQQMLCPCTLGCSALEQCFLPALFSNYTKIYFSIGRMRLSQGLLDNKYEEMQVPWDWLTKKKQTVRD